MFRQGKDGTLVGMYSVITYLLSFVTVCCRL